MKACSSRSHHKRLVWALVPPLPVRHGAGVEWLKQDHSKCSGVSAKLTKLQSLPAHTGLQEQEKSLILQHGWQSLGTGCPGKQASSLKVLDWSKTRSSKRSPCSQRGGWHRVTCRSPFQLKLSYDYLENSQLPGQMDARRTGRTNSIKHPSYVAQVPSNAEARGWGPYLHIFSNKIKRFLLFPAFPNHWGEMYIFFTQRVEPKLICLPNSANTSSDSG